MEKLITSFLYLFLILTLAVILKPNAEIIRQNNQESFYYSSTEHDLLFKKVENNPINSVIKISYRQDLSELLNVNIDSASATGFSIKYNQEDNKSYIITNDHFCSAESTTYPGKFVYQNSKVIAATDELSGTLKIVAKDSTLDLCLLETNGFVQPIRLAKDNYIVDQLESVKIIGAPLGVFPIIVDSKVTNLLDHSVLPNPIRNEIPILLISDIFMAGQSGSPVINSNNEVIGVFFISYSNPSMTSYGGGALHINALKIFLSENNIII